MTRERFMQGGGFGLATLLFSGALLLGCGEAPSGAAPVVPFEKDAEAVRVVRSVREALASGARPSSEEVQQFKSVAQRHVGEPFVEEALMAILPALQDWDGMASYFEAKPELTDDERKLLARVYIRQADYGAARDLILPLAERDVTDTEANALAARALYFFGENEAAARHYDRVWDALLSEQRFQDISFRAMIWFDQGDAGKAREILEQALEVQPDSVAIHNALSRVLAAVGEDEEAREHSQRVDELQREISKRETGQMRVAAQIFEINRALQAGDVDACRERIFRLLPEADEGLREQLYGFLDGLYRRVGREAEVPGLLEQARQIASQRAED